MRVHEQIEGRPTLAAHPDTDVHVNGTAAMNVDVFFGL